MKKIFLFSAAMAAAFGASALEPTVLDNTQCIQVSPDGKMVGSDLFGTVMLYDVETGKKTTFTDEVDYLEYTLGQGQCFSETGVAVGEYGSTPCYIIGGEWNPLPVINTDFPNLANAISADGLRICGSIGMTGMTIEDTKVPMMVPCVWNRTPEGNYDNRVDLPYPALDFTGRVPQYVTAHAMSADGKTVVGQVRDYTGFINYLIWYTEDENGEWSYTLSPEDLYNPDHLTFPEWPGEAPEMPQLEDFMSESEKAAYDAAVAEWNEKGDYDWDTYPEMEDYISADNKAIYEAAKAEYDILEQAYYEKYDAFEAVYEQVEAVAKNLEFNNVTISLDGKTAASSSIAYKRDPLDPWSMGTPEGGPITINLVDKTFKEYPSNLAMPQAITEDGTMFAVVNNGQVPMYAVVYAPGSTEAMTLEEYFATANPAMAEWVKENMYHDLETWDDEAEEMVELNLPCTGNPHASKDRSVIITHAPNDWDYDSDALSFSYILPGHATEGVKALDLRAEVKANGERGGIINLEGAPCRLTVTDMSGRVVYEAENATGRVETGLATGAYIVRAEALNTKAVVKTAL